MLMKCLTMKKERKNKMVMRATKKSLTSMIDSNCQKKIEDSFGW